MNAEIISIGTELLLGHVVDTNSSFLSRKLAELGIDVYHHTTVGDNPARIVEAIRRALTRADIVMMTGGLGPTVDDVTAITVINFVGKKPVKQIRNRVGTAPGLIAECRDKVIVCLPGPPREAIPMFENDIKPYIKKRFRGEGVIRSRVIKLTGLAESQVDAKVRSLLNLKPPTTVGIYAKLGEVDLKIMSKAKSEKEASKAIAGIEKKIRSKLKNYIFGCDDETLEGAVGKILAKKKKTLAVAESCTGGLISNRITDVEGSSRYFTTGIVTYSNESKENFLGVNRDSIRKYGAVSEEVSLEMAKGIKHFACADIGLAVTGIAGPDGGSKKKPIGIVYIALVTDKKKMIKEYRFSGSRVDIKWKTSQAALELLRRHA